MELAAEGVGAKDRALNSVSLLLGCLCSKAILTLDRVEMQVVILVATATGPIPGEAPIEKAAVSLTVEIAGIKDPVVVALGLVERAGKGQLVVVTRNYALEVRLDMRWRVSDKHILVRELGASGGHKGFKGTLRKIFETK